MKGFTLIELLAVIVILAIIALIATPIVLSIINDTKESAVIRSAEFYVDAVQSKIMQENMKQGGSLNPSECIINNEGNASCDGTLLEIEVNGQKPSGGNITFDKGKVTEVNLTFGDKNVSLNTNGELVLTDEVKLAPGLYDENDNLLISWKDLTSTEYQSITYYDEQLEAEVTRAILNVDENGVLRTALEYNHIGYLIYNHSASYIVGKLVIDESVTSIGDSAFYGCSNLTSITIPNSVTSIEGYAFSGSGLTSVIIPNSITLIKYSTFSNCNSLTNVTIPNSVTSIEGYAFASCTNLTSIAIPNSVTSIEYYVFSGSGLTSVTIPDSVTRIEEAVFYNCSNLMNITIPVSVTYINTYAITGCTSLKTINYKGTETNWNNITKGLYWDLNSPSNKVINYNYVG